MRKLFLAAAVATAFAVPAQAADLSMDSVLGTTMTQVRESLTRMGYEVRKSEIEHGRIEVYFVKDRTMGEVYVSTRTGKPTRLKIR